MEKQFPLSKVLKNLSLHLATQFMCLSCDDGIGFTSAWTKQLLFAVVVSNSSQWSLTMSYAGAASRAP